MANRPDVAFAHTGNQPSEDFFEESVRAMYEAIGHLLKGDGLTAPSLRVVTAPSVLEAATVEADHLGLPPDRRSGAERVGGLVAGKCLVSDDSERAVVIVDHDVLLARDGRARIHAARIVGHELGHVAYARSRIAAIGVFPDVWLPWEIAGRIAVVAAEEYRVDSLSTALCTAVLNPTDDAGKKVDLKSMFLPHYSEALPSALDQLCPGLEETIMRYRTHQIPLEEMWSRVVKISEELAIFLAHTDSHNASTVSALEAVDHASVSLLEPLWRPIFDHLRSGSPIPAPDAWAADRAVLTEIGRVGFTSVWAQLGLVATPQDDSFHLAVSEPAFRSTT